MRRIKIIIFYCWGSVQNRETEKKRSWNWNSQHQFSFSSAETTFWGSWTFFNSLSSLSASVMRCDGWTKKRSDLFLFTESHHVAARTRHDIRLRQILPENLFLSLSSQSAKKLFLFTREFRQVSSWGEDSHNVWNPNPNDAPTAVFENINQSQ